MLPDEVTKRAEKRVLLPPGEPQPCLIVLSSAISSLIGKMYRLDKREMTIGRELTADVRVPDDGISRQHTKLRISPDNKNFVFDLNSTNGTFVDGKRVQSAQLTDGCKVQLGNSIIFKYIFQDVLEERFQTELFRSVVRDNLTGLYNARYFKERLVAETSFSRRHGRPLVVIVLDIDGFKAVNDTYGFHCGDCVLRDMSLFFNHLVRMEDVLTRISGAKFGLIVREATLEGGVQMAERLRTSIESHDFIYEEEKVQVTVSAGVTSYDGKSERTPSELLDRTEENLSQAKRKGRNRVVAE